MLRKNWKNLFSFILIFFGLLATAHFAGAQIDAGTDVINNTIALGSDDPRAIIARVINIALLFLGIVAVGIVLYAGFKWMTSEGDEQRIADAKKILKNGVIGLMIILSAWGIASFVLSRLITATNNNVGDSCTSGGTCGLCGGYWQCDSSPAGKTCINENCLDPVRENCNIDLGDTGCASGTCSEGSQCDKLSCTCEKQGSLGEPCSDDLSGGTCTPDQNKCGPYLKCGETSCLCEGAPTITEVSPVGGFCKGAINTPCESDANCTSVGDTCNLTNPNGAAKNLLTISGYNFGDYASSSKVIFVPTSTLPEIIANFPTICPQSWQDKQIIIAVPVDLASLTEGYSFKVVRADNQTDSSIDKNGPILPNFIANNIVRPGLCSLEPSPSRGGILAYKGINLLNTEGYFGNYINNIKGATSTNGSNTSDISGSMVIPDLKTGLTNVFVRKTNTILKSNFLRFEKASQPPNAYFISSFSPIEGRSGQYVTISGKGFGRIRGNSSVYFGAIATSSEASFKFPKICADSIWSDEQIIVKVPENFADGSYTIIIDIPADGKVLSTESLVPNSTFTVASTSPLLPGLCKMEPIIGQVNTPVTLWGEYFGTTNELGKAKFYSGQATSSTIQTMGSSDKAQYLVSNVPESSASGPVVVVKLADSSESNPLNFSVGACKDNSECGARICCPEGTYKKGQCLEALKDCASSSKNSVFEWTFNTNYSKLVDNYSCNGWAQATGACQTGSTCPNSPGQCSPFSLAVPVATGNCCATGFTYDALSGKCLAVAQPISCDLSFRATTSSPNINCQATASGANHWFINSASTPAITSTTPIWINLGSGKFTNSTSTTVSDCNLCAAGSTCFDNRGTTTALYKGASDSGICSQAVACPGGSTCNATNSQCYAQPSCQCCCTVGSNDCCTGLTCGGSCGSDTSTSTTKEIGALGRCGGCASVGNSAADHDAACSCTGHSGQYCETTDPNYPSGYCTDCDSLTQDNCTDHSSACCVDERNGYKCRSGSGEVIASTSPNYGFGSCAYYDCPTVDLTTSSTASSNQCTSSSTPIVNGLYSSLANCDKACQENGGTNHCSSYNNNVTACTDDTSCCYDAKNEKCTGGGGNRISTGSDAGKCAYYNCTNGVCDALSAPNTTSGYLGYDNCERKCKPGSDMGKSCSGYTIDTCDVYKCGSSFSCLQDTGSTGTASDSCGTCCCKVGPTGNATCKSLNSPLSDKLTCQPNQAPCSGAGRGLCCGCSKDAECGDTTAGCDSSSCCRARPNVVSSSTVPIERAENVCRNALVRVVFDQAMNPESFVGNVLLLEKHAQGSSCPAGTFLADNKLIEKNKQENLLARMINRLKYFGQNLFSIFSKQDTALAFEPPVDADVYCSIPGAVSSEKNDQGNTALSSTLVFTPKKILAPNTTYYIVVKGDEFLQSNSGVLSLWNVGLNDIVGLKYATGSSTLASLIKFNNISYDNSYISVFKTLEDQGPNAGLCTIDQVKISPASYLFQTNEKDLNETDTPATDKSFDTKADNDKVFSAYALSADKQYLATSTVYNWDWRFQVADSNVVNTSTLSGLWANKVLVTAALGVKDGSTKLTATVDMSSYPSNITPSGNQTESTAPIYVFVCANPWPAVGAGNTWNPWMDEACTSPTSCPTYNYKFYYCRDAGQPGTADDLPAIVSAPVVNGPSSAFICSYGGLACNQTGLRCGQDKNGDGAADGFCIFSVLKESYFFRSATPEVVTISSLADQKSGGTVAIIWSSDSTLPAGNILDSYKIYYGLSGGEQISKKIKLTDTVNNSLICTLSNNKYICTYLITGLTDNKLYSFRMTALTANNAESELSEVKEVTPTDTTQPQSPSGFGAGGTN